MFCVEDTTLKAKEEGGEVGTKEIWVLAIAVAIDGIHVCAQGDKEPKRAQDVHENQLQRSNSEVI